MRLHLILAYQTSAFAVCLHLSTDRESRRAICLCFGFGLNPLQGISDRSTLLCSRQYDRPTARRAWSLVAIRHYQLSLLTEFPGDRTATMALCVFSDVIASTLSARRSAHSMNTTGRDKTRRSRTEGVIRSALCDCRARNSSFNRNPTSRADPLSI